MAQTKGKPNKRPTRRRSLASRAARKVGGKHPVVKAVVYVAVGSVVVVGKGAALAGKSVAGAARSTTHATANVIEQRRATRVGVDPTTAGSTRATVGRLRRASYRCACTDEPFMTMAALNRHFVQAHGSEAPPHDAEKQPAARVRRTPERVTAGRVRRGAPTRPTRAPRTPHSRPRHLVLTDERGSLLVNAYSDDLNNLRSELMTKSGAATALVKAAQAIADLPIPRTMGDLFDEVTAVEQALFALDRTMYERFAVYKRGGPRGLGLDPALVNPRVSRFGELVAQAAEQLTIFVAQFQDLYAMHIRAATGDVDKPNLDLSKTG
jgi:hypothetical protein